MHARVGSPENALSPAWSRSQTPPPNLNARGESRSTRFSTDLRRNVGVHSNAIVHFNYLTATFKSSDVSLPAMAVLNFAARRPGYESPGAYS